jgi:hypothetical protein
MIAATGQEICQKWLTNQTFDHILLLTLRKEGNKMAYFEATQEQKQLAAIGREMMDYSENYGVEFGLKGVTDDGLRTLNELSHVGNMLTHYGATFGTTLKDFTQEDLQLIARFMKKEVDIERK